MDELSAPARSDRRLLATPLDGAAFRPFGDVIDRRSALTKTYAINEGSASRAHDLSRVDASTRGGHVAISIVHVKPRLLPFRLQCMERHRRGSQAFVPLTAARWIVVVAAPGHSPRFDQLRAFVASAEQGVNYARGTWHHPLLAIDRNAEFLVVDRVSDNGEEDCEVCDLRELGLWLGAESRNL